MKVLRTSDAAFADLPDFNAGRVVNGGTAQKISDTEVATDNTPQPADGFKAGVEQMFPTRMPAAAGHFLQDDMGPNLARASLDCVGATGEGR